MPATTEVGWRPLTEVPHASIAVAQRPHEVPARLALDRPDALTSRTRERVARVINGSVYGNYDHVPDEDAEIADLRPLRLPPYTDSLVQ